MPGLSEKIRQLISEIESKEMKEILSEKFQVNLDNTEVITTLRGYSRMKDGKIHSIGKITEELKELDEEMTEHEWYRKNRDAILLVLGAGTFILLLSLSIIFILILDYFSL